MMATRRARRWAAGCVVAATMGLPASAGAQAWVTPAREGSVSVYYSFLRSNEHLDRNGRGTRELGTESIHAVALDMAYGLSDRIAVEGSIGWLATKWVGDPGDRHGPLDIGSYHGSFHDARVVLRYQMATRPLAFAPFVAFSAPTHAYETRGHSAFGRRLRELQAGASVGRSLPGLFRGGYVHASAAYTFSEEVENVPLSLDRVSGAFEFGAGVAPKFALRGFGAWQVMWDGLQLGPQTEHLELRPIHDRLARSSYLNLGAGGAFPVGSRLDLEVSAYTTVVGRNFHALRGLVTSLTWRFGGDFTIERASSGGSGAASGR